MDRSEILLQIQSIAQQVIQDPNIRLSEEMTSKDVDGWDSMADVAITEEIKKHFAIKVSLREMVSWDSIGDIIDCIEKKI